MSNILFGRKIILNSKVNKEGSRFRITDLATGRRFDVEAIQPRHEHRTDFGDSLDNFCAGAIGEEDSLISNKTHKNISYVRNPMDVVRELLKKRIEVE